MKLKHVRENIYLVEGVPPNTPQSTIGMKISAFLTSSKKKYFATLIELHTGRKTGRLYARIS